MGPSGFPVIIESQGHLSAVRASATERGALITAGKGPQLEPIREVTFSATLFTHLGEAGRDARPSRCGAGAVSTQPQPAAARPESTQPQPAAAQPESAAKPQSAAAHAARGPK